MESTKRQGEALAILTIIFFKKRGCRKEIPSLLPAPCRAFCTELQKKPSFINFSKTYKQVKSFEIRKKKALSAQPYL